MSNKSGLALALVLSVMVGISVYLWQENRISSLSDNNSKIVAEKEQLELNLDELDEALEVLELEVEQNAIVDDFEYDEGNQDYYGNLIVNGYMTLSEMPEAFCEEDCLIYTYAFFNVLETDNEFFADYIESQTGNAFVGEASIGLGCVENDILWRINDSDEFGMQEYTTSQEMSEAILSSDKENPVTIEIERYLLTLGSGAPDCYSPFAKVGLVESGD
jgi:hypothetical protein